MQGMLLFFNKLYGFLEFVCVYFATILGFCAIISIFVLGIIMILRSTLLSKSVFGKAALWCLLIPVIFCGKLHVYYETKAGLYLMLWWHDLCVGHTWIGVLYIIVILALGFKFWWRRKKLTDSVNRFYDSEEYSSKYVIKVFPGELSSFCTGCIRPLIVIPESISSDEAGVVIKHEETHIMLGHLWILLAYDILRVMLWPNLFLHLCVGYMKRDLEDICDTVTIQRSGIDACDYGETILGCARNMMQTRKKLGCEGGMSFAWDDSYKILKKRLERIVARKAYNLKILSIGAVALVILVVASVGIIKANSYNRTNDLGMISGICYTGNAQKIYTDVERSIVVDFDDDYIYVDGKALLEQYPEAKGTDEWFHISSGGYYKIPGIGGGGGWAEINAKEIHDGIIKLDNHTDMDIWDRIIMWL